MSTTLTDSPALAVLYRAGSTPRLVDVPPLQYLMIDGHGDPNTSARYQSSVQALYSIAYAVKFALRRATGADLKVAPLEGLWWAADLRVFDAVAPDKSAWDWTMMIRQPDVVTPAFLAGVANEVAAKKKLAAASDVRLETYAEGQAAQILHLGPYSTEGPTIARLHAFIREQGLRFGDPALRHHEIYLGDPRRAAPERLRTIIRQPARPA